MLPLRYMKEGPPTAISLPWRASPSAARIPASSFPTLSLAFDISHGGFMAGHGDTGPGAREDGAAMVASCPAGAGWVPVWATAPPAAAAALRREFARLRGRAKCRRLAAPRARVPTRPDTATALCRDPVRLRTCSWRKPKD